MTPATAYQWLLNHYKETAYLQSTDGLLAWDMRTFIPAQGFAHRAEQLATITRLVHLRRTDPQIADRLDAVEASAWLDDPISAEAVNVREWRRDFDRATKIPEQLMVRIARVSAEAESCWQAARGRNDWAAFKPYLEQIVALKREEAALLEPADELYDALLDEYEPGETARGLEAIFATLRDSLVALLDQVRNSSKTPDASILHRDYPPDRQERLAREVVGRIGYDFSAGRLDVSAHPFTVGIGPGDVRITTRYNPSYFGSGFFASVHEAGHALYEQGLPAEHWGTPRGQAASLGIHESQSRLWENFIARSRSFWQAFYPPAVEQFPHLQNVDLDSFTFAVNEVKPGLIRTEADEVTYNLHILLRYELELALLRGDLEVAALPAAWNERMQSYLGVVPQDEANGVMQDIHWAAGAIGYFPTYTLGNLYAAQLFARARRELPSLDGDISRGDFTPLLGWLRKNVHEEGCRYRPRDLIQKVTGEALNPACLIHYLRQKYGDLYGF